MDRKKVFDIIRIIFAVVFVAIWGIVMFDARDGEMFILIGATFGWMLLLFYIIDIILPSSEKEEKK